MKHFILIANVSIWAYASLSLAQTTDLDKVLDRAAERITSEKYSLRYRLQQGEVVTYRVEHVATVDTTISGNNQKTKLRSVSVRSLLVTNVDDDGSATFDHTIDEVDMWSEVSGRKAVRYNSKTDEEPPAEFEKVAESIGSPISRITMDAFGNIVNREDKIKQVNLGMGGLSIPLPQEAVPIGHRWSTPLTVKVRLEDKRVKEIKTRELYTLEKVSAGVATISIKTQILTPIKNAKVKSQMIQRISKGEIKFDLDAGRLISKRLDWDENVLGFNGADSNMKYLARFSEELVKDPSGSDKKTASREPRSKK